MEYNLKSNKPSVETVNLINKLTVFKKPSDLAIFIESLDDKKIKLLTEIIINLLNNRIEVNNSVLRRLSPFKNLLRSIVSKKVGQSSRKKFFLSVKGLYILFIIIPSVFKTVIKYF